ncbi:hypothetical protein C8034_v001984 [Colletotrichum sidae]|uniref:Uncharacterized protein n=1 Tax=Colletotrichum sidae TaxID=1347389 RepID=A0A4R8TCZ3_9PEZI|nr:hypothetical protein C8034_v001984 [Colletotrichum sidae]
MRMMRGVLVQSPEKQHGDIRRLRNSLLWLSEGRLLCDPDDEFGQLIPRFQYQNAMDEVNIEDSDSIEYIYEVIDPQKLRPRSKASTIEVHVARANSQGGFYINGDVGKKVYPGFGCKTFDERCYATVHAACLEIAEKVHVSGLAHIRDSLGHSPVEIESLTACLLRNLQQRHSEFLFAVEANARDLEKRLSKLPPEIIDNILVHLGRDLPKECTRIVPAIFWVDQLKKARRPGLSLLPWLWDIEPDLIDAKAAEPCPGGVEFEWDWELFVRQLTHGFRIETQPGVPTDYDTVDGSVVWQTIATGHRSDLTHVPAGLHNRWRIWHLLEKMYVGDALDYVEDEDLILEDFPLNWDKAGRVVA